MANISISGGTSPTVAVYGKNVFVSAGVGTDSVGSTTGTTVSAGKLGSVSLGASALGNDTINLGSGLDTIVQSGVASLTTAFSNALGSSSVAGGLLSNAGNEVTGLLSGVPSSLATVIGGALDTSAITVNNAGLDLQGVTSGISPIAGTTVGNALLDVQGVAQGPPQILAATLNDVTQAGGVTVSNALLDVQGVAQGPPAILGATTQNTGTQLNGVFSSLTSTIHATSADSLIGGAGNASNFLTSDAAGQNTVTNFVSGSQMSVDGYSLSYLQSHHDITSQGGNTYISIDGGKTSIELKGIGGLTNSESNLHKS